MVLISEVACSVIIVSIIIGLIVVAAFSLWLLFKKDPDFQDDDDMEIYEQEYWKKNR